MKFPICSNMNLNYTLITLLSTMSSRDRPPYPHPSARSSYDMDNPASRRSGEYSREGLSRDPRKHFSPPATSSTYRAHSPAASSRADDRPTAWSPVSPLPPTPTSAPPPPPNSSAPPFPPRTMQPANRRPAPPATQSLSQEKATLLQRDVWKPLLKYVLADPS